MHREGASVPFHRVRLVSIAGQTLLYLLISQVVAEAFQSIRHKVRYADLG